VQEAARVAADELPDAVVCDWQLPDGTAADLFAQITPLCPLAVVVSDRPREKIEPDQLRRLSAFRWLRKPFDVRSLIDHLQADAPEDVS
jgi:DNA-binding response OmpR family regulator